MWYSVCVKSHIISIHAPRAGSDIRNGLFLHPLYRFQSTLPVRGATLLLWRGLPSGAGFQSTLPVRGATYCDKYKIKLSKFQSTLPVRGATKNVRNHSIKQIISIHAPRAGSDVCHGRYRFHRKNFNPRSPCGERQRGIQLVAARFIFQSTLPVRGATEAWLMGLDVPIFQSTLPVRGATEMSRLIDGAIYISIHAPRAGSDSYSTIWCSGYKNFNPRSPCGERR